MEEFNLTSKLGWICMQDNDRTISLGVRDGINHSFNWKHKHYYGRCSVS